MQREKNPALGFILGLVFFFMAPYAADKAGILYAASMTAFNLFLVGWIDVMFYVLAVFFFSLALGSLFDR